MPRKRKKMSIKHRWVFVLVLIFFSVQLILPAVVSPRQAQAFLGVTVTVGDIPRLVMDYIGKVLKTAADVAFKNLLKNYLNTIAYNFAVKIATGESGQKPYYEIKPLDLLKDTANAAAGDLLSDIASDWIGLSRCQGYPTQKSGKSGCKADSSCPNVKLICPINIPYNEGDCSSSLEGKSKCLAAGCRIFECTDLDCDKQIGDSIMDGIGIHEFVQTKKILEGAPECISTFSLCDLGDPQLKINLVLMATQSTFGEPPPDLTGQCPMTDILDKYYEYREDFQKNAMLLCKNSKFISDADCKKYIGNVDPDAQYLVELSKTFNPKATQLGAYLEIKGKTELHASIRKEAKEFAQGLSKEFKPVTSVISGWTKTPGAFLEGIGDKMLGGAFSEQFAYTGTAIADAIGVFTNTLTSKLIERYFFGLDDQTSKVIGRKGFASGGSTPGITAAKLRFSDLKKTEFTVGGDIDLLSKLASCPDNVDMTPDTCVIDSQFRSAIDQQLTVREAVDQGLLNGLRVFGFDNQGSEPEYYAGYPYRSLLILRKYRIIPVGWELAAKYIRDYGRASNSLNTLLNVYDDPDSPFYHLVDPNWVLKAPAVFCKRSGAGEKIYSSTAVRVEDTNYYDPDVPPLVDGNELGVGVDTGDVATYFIQRQDDYCADEQQCLREDDDGGCDKWGYCMEEERIFKFDSTSCDAQFASCVQLEKRGGGAVSYLLNTVDFNGCSVDNVGCQWYCMDYDKDAESWMCTDAKPGAVDNAGNDIDNTEKIALSASASDCNPKQEGCSEFVRVRDSGANLLKGSEFESFYANPPGMDGVKDSGVADEFNNWIQWCGFGANQGVRMYAVSDKFEGFTAAKLVSEAVPCGPWAGTVFEAGYSVYQTVDTGAPTNERVFTVSLYAKTDTTNPNCDGTNGQFGVHLLRRPDTTDPLTWDNGTAMNIAASSAWTRYTGQVVYGTIDTWPSNTQSYIDVVINRPAGDNCPVIIDNMQLEEGGLTSFKIYEDSLKSYFTKAPGYLGCTGNEVTDLPECSNFLLMCEASEVGCEAYRARSSNQIVTGVITRPEACNPGEPASCDQCPPEFVGCSAFRELSIERMPKRPARDPVSFMPASGETCPASAVGCEEYTNLEEIALGGEGKEHYSYIRICVEPDDADLETYYTWEGSSEFGFQLREYTLKRSNLASGDPCTNVGAEGDPALVALGIDWPSCIDDEDIDLDGVIDYPAASCSAAEVETNPDCTEFYDTAGGKHYVLKSRVIYSSNICKSYKNTIDSTATCDIGICSNSGLGCAVDDDCRGHVYHMIPDDGVSCRDAYASCREYKGNAGDNFQEVYYEDFEDGTVDPWVGSVSYSNESVNVDGHSMLVANSGAINNVGSALGMDSERSYTISFWAKSGVNADTPINISINSIPPQNFRGLANAKEGDWSAFELGPLFIPPGVDISTSQLVLFSTNAFYIDNIIITEITDSIYRIQNTYIDCSGYEGCDAYTDRSGFPHFLKSFSRLCREDRVGCEVMIDTHNSRSPNSERYNVARYMVGDVNDDGKITMADVNIIQSGTPYHPVPVDTGDADRDGVVNNAVDAAFLTNFLAGVGPAPSPAYDYITQNVPEDNFIIVVNDPEKSCGASSKGCQRFGLPIIDNNKSLLGFQNNYLANNPDTYAEDLCYFSETDCEEYSGGGSTYYFKDPGLVTCEYKRITGQDKSGWYKTGTNVGVPDCPVGTGICTGGGENDGSQCNSSDDCDSNNCNITDKITGQPLDGFVGTCPPEESGCTEYRDPENPPEASELTMNFFNNSSFEDYITTPNAAAATDGIVDHDVCPAGTCSISSYICAVDQDCYVPDQFLSWTSHGTLSGTCNAGPHTGWLCNDDEGCGRCNASVDAVYTSQPRFCDADADCDAGDTCDFIAPGVCVDAGVARLPCGNGLVATTDAYHGTTAAIVKVYDVCRNSAGDTAMYTWVFKGIDTDKPTDNKQYKLSFHAKRNPLDPDCLALPANDPSLRDRIGANLYRTIDDRGAGIGFGEQLGGFAYHVNTTSWEQFDYTFEASSVPIQDGAGNWHDWVSVSGNTLEEQKRSIDFVFRRDANGFPSQTACDIIIDNVSLTEVEPELNYSSYYYIDDTVDKSTCNGLVSREEGCRLFNDTSDYTLPWSSVSSVNGEPPVNCATGVDCDSNIVLKVRNDRQCSKWLECETALRVQSEEEGDYDEFCLSRFICDDMDEETGHCTSSYGFEKVDQTFSTPAFADEIRNMTGYILTGLDWERRCKNDPTIVCTADNQCGAGGVCDDPQVVPGELLIPAMEEQGSITSGVDLIKHGDFGDSDYDLNHALSVTLSTATPAVPDPPRERDVTDINALAKTKWNYRGHQQPPPAQGWHDADAPDIFWTEENVNNGQIPSENSNLDENNVIRVITKGYSGTDQDGDGTTESGMWNGVAYDLTTDIIAGDEYVVSLRLRWATTPNVYDWVRIEFGYRNTENQEVSWHLFADVRPTEKWQTFTLGPIEARDNQGAQLNIIHKWLGLPDNTVPPVEFYVDDVSMKPVLKTSANNTCEGGPRHGEVCTSDLDCGRCKAAPAIPCFDDTVCDDNIAGDTCDSNGGSCGLDQLEPRACRLYPRTEAQYCSYTDENNTTYEGWYGYCLERDPNHPKYCINWWPVDLLRGDSNMFSTLRTVEYAGRRPLYMCVGTAGNYNKPITASYQSWTGNTFPDFVADSSGWWVCDGVSGGDPNNGGTPRYRGPVSPLSGRYFNYRRPFVTRHFQGPSLFGLPSWGGKNNCDEYGDVENYGPARQNLFAGVVFGCDVGGGNFCQRVSLTTALDVQDQYYKWEVEKIAVMGQVWSHKDWNPTDDDSTLTNAAYYNDVNACAGKHGGEFAGRSSRNTPDGQAYMVFPVEEADAYPAHWNSNYWSQMWSNNRTSCDGNIFELTLMWDGSGPNARLTDYATYMLDADDGGAFAASVIVYLRDQCEVIAEVVTDDKDKAWYARTLGTSGYESPELLYRLEQNYAPFGGIVAPSGTPNTWRADAGNGPLYVETRPDSTEATAGSPYSFIGGRCSGSGQRCIVNGECPAPQVCQQPDGTSGGRLCTAYVGSNPGDMECLDQTAVAACEAAGGVCKGVGVGFCLSDTSRFCTEANEDLPVGCLDAGRECITGICDGGGRDQQTCGGVCVGGNSPNIPCGVNADCAFGTCQMDTDEDCPGGACRIGGGAAPNHQTYVGGINSLKRLFATAFNGWTWQDDDATYRYMSNDLFIGQWRNDYATMTTCPYSAAQGKAVRPAHDMNDTSAGGCSDNGADCTAADLSQCAVPATATCVTEYCGVPPIIKDIKAGIGGLAQNVNYIELKGGGNIQFTFRIEADENQKPIKYIEVDWGDLTGNYITSGSFDNGSVFLSHEYQLLGSHEPKIKVYDNWDWCGVPDGAGSACPGAGADCRWYADDPDGAGPLGGDDCDGIGIPGFEEPNGFVNSGIIIEVTP